MSYCIIDFGNNLIIMGIICVLGIYCKVGVSGWRWFEIIDKKM